MATVIAEGDTVLAYHGPMIYEAKVLKVESIASGAKRYYVHYQGWNKKWDEWVDDNRCVSLWRHEPLTAPHPPPPLTPHLPPTHSVMANTADNKRVMETLNEQTQALERAKKKAGEKAEGPGGGGPGSGGGGGGSSGPLGGGGGGGSSGAAAGGGSSGPGARRSSTGAGGAGAGGADSDRLAGRKRKIDATREVVRRWFEIAETGDARCGMNCSHSPFSPALRTRRRRRRQTRRCASRWATR